jgi:transcriptional regulator with XRE-family HTH domain
MAARQSEAERGVFAVLLRQLREARGLTQESLARDSGVSVRAIQDLESGRRRHPQFHTVNCLAQALSVNSSEQEALTAAARTHRNVEAAHDNSSPVAAEESSDTPDPHRQPKKASRRRAGLVASAAAVLSTIILLLLLPGLGFEFGAAAPPAAPTAKTAPTLTEIVSPTDGAVIPGDVRVHGTASLPTGTELWLLLQPEHGDSSYFGTTPEPIKVDASGAWMADIRVGRGPRDGGYKFRLFAVVSPINEGIHRHVKLLPKGKRYPKMAEIPADCFRADEIEVTRAN